MCTISMVVGAPRNCSRFVCRYGFHEDVLNSVYVPILLYCCTRIQYFALAIILSDSGKRMHRDKIPPQRMHAACRIVARGHVVPSALRSSTATVEAIVVWNSWSRRYPPQMRENLLPVRIIRRFVQTTRFTVLWGVHLDRIRRKPIIIAITSHFSRQTLLEPLSVSRARASCFSERYRDVLYQNSDENNCTQTSIDCCTVVLRT